MQPREEKCCNTVVSMHYQCTKVSNFTRILRTFTKFKRFAVCSKQPAIYLHSSVSAESNSEVEVMAKSVGESHNFPKEEESILELWKKLDAFKNSLKQSEGKPRLLLNSYVIFSLNCRLQSSR